MPPDRHQGFDVAPTEATAELAWRSLQRMAAGDQEGLAGLYDLFASRVYSLALRMLRDAGDAEEVVQDVFAQAWRSAALYDRDRGTVGAWLIVMARSRSLDRLRSKRAGSRAIPATNADPDLLADSAVPQDLVAISRQQAEGLRRALDDLPGDQRSAIELAYFEGLSHPEVAARLAQPLGTVKTRIRLGLMKLREAFARSSEQDRSA